MKPILPRVSTYTSKDQRKADISNKFIGQGSERSATEAYAKVFRALRTANTGSYFKNDTVFVSVEGNRRHRLEFDKHEVLLAVQAGAKIVCDNEASRFRSYNVGERKLALFLSIAGCEEIETNEYYSIFRLKTFI